MNDSVSFMPAANALHGNLPPFFQKVSLLQSQPGCSALSIQRYKEVLNLECMMVNTSFGSVPTPENYVAIPRHPKVVGNYRYLYAAARPKYIAEGMVSHHPQTLFSSREEPNSLPLKRDDVSVLYWPRSLPTRDCGWGSALVQAC